jgi:hypothetical protein
MYSSSAASFQERRDESDSLSVAIAALISADAPQFEVALAYRRHGIPVFPLRAETKTPYGKGHHVATIDEVKISEWWRASPQAMIGAGWPPAASGLSIWTSARRNQR